MDDVSISSSEGADENSVFSDNDTSIGEYASDSTVDGEEVGRLQDEPMFAENGSDDSDDEGEEVFEKMDSKFRNDIIQQFHPELKSLPFDQIESLCKLSYDPKTGYDSLHQTLPFLTKYERTRVLGERAKQLEGGAKPLIPESSYSELVDCYLIAVKELEQKKIPFIIVRPFPGNTGCEYWKLNDLLP
jgi:DNA-directed RNA polymerase subunit K/omega